MSLKAHGYFAGDASKENGLLMENDPRNAKQSESGNEENPVIEVRKSMLYFLYGDGYNSSLTFSEIQVST